MERFDDDGPRFGERNDDPIGRTGIFGWQWMGHPRFMNPTEIHPGSNVGNGKTTFGRSPTGFNLMGIRELKQLLDLALECACYFQ